MTANPNAKAPSAPFAEVYIDGREYVPKDWHGLMSILADVYPADIFDGSSGDPGPTIVVLLRERDRLTGALSAVREVVTADADLTPAPDAPGPAGAYALGRRDVARAVLRTLEGDDPWLTSP